MVGKLHIGESMVTALEAGESEPVEPIWLEGHCRVHKVKTTIIFLRREL